MNILILGSGGREHAFAWKIAQSSHCKNLYIAPGNAGTAQVGTNIALSITNFEDVKQCCIANQIDLVVVGPEEPCVLGIYDFFIQDKELQHIIVVAPSKQGAQLEGSKAFAKKFMQRHNIPTAGYQEFTSNTFEEGITYIQQHTLPIVLKADGLAAGKGVVICTSIEEAIANYTDMLQHNKFGTASNTVVIEQFLEGIELSVFALTNGSQYILLPNAKDYKRIGEGDTGSNTGGMGAISPVPFADDAFMKKVIDTVVEPTIKGLQKEEIVYNGFVFIGLIKVNEEPYVIEYNCRMGDPETEVVLPRLENDLVDLFIKMNTTKLHTVTCKHTIQEAATVVLVSGGYPGNFEKGKDISGFQQITNSIIFHAATKEEENKIRTNGGRVLAITSFGHNIKEAAAKSTTNAEKINFENKYYRKDIGFEF